MFGCCSLNSGMLETESLTLAGLHEDSLNKWMLNRWLHNVNSSSTFVGKSKLPWLTFVVASQGHDLKHTSNRWNHVICRCQFKKPARRPIHNYGFRKTNIATAFLLDCLDLFRVMFFHGSPSQVGSNSAERSFFPQDWSGKCWKWYGLKMHKLYLAVQCSFWK